MSRRADGIKWPVNGSSLACGKEVGYKNISKIVWQQIKVHGIHDG